MWEYIIGNSNCKFFFCFNFCSVDVRTLIANHLLKSREKINYAKNLEHEEEEREN